MKKIILTSIAALCLLNLTSQTDSAALKKNSLSINVNGLLSQVFTGNNNSQSLLTYRRHFSKYNLRIGLGGYMHVNDDFSADITTYNFSYGRTTLRSGVEFPVLRYNKWHAYLGVETVVGLYQHTSKRRFDNGVFEHDKTELLSVGLSAPCGINYQLNQLISFGAEAAYDVLYETGTTESYSSFGGTVYNETKELHNNLIASYSSPIRLQVRIHF